MDAWAEWLMGKNDGTKWNNEVIRICGNTIHFKHCPRRTKKTVEFRSALLRMEDKNKTSYLVIYILFSLSEIKFRTLAKPFAFDVCFKSRHFIHPLLEISISMVEPPIRIFPVTSYAILQRVLRNPRWAVPTTCRLVVLPSFYLRIRARYVKSTDLRRLIYPTKRSWLPRFLRPFRVDLNILRWKASTIWLHHRRIW